jgi:uncharacterized membrane protein
MENKPKTFKRTLNADNLKGLFSCILGIYIFVTAISSMEGIIITALALLFFGFIEYWVVYGGYLLSSAFCKKYY